MLAKGDKVKAGLYTKLATVSLKAAKACRNDDLKALMSVNNEYLKLTKRVCRKFCVNGQT